ncbi:M20 family metallopeptidase [Candidatus Omnitrophota bacterium]
MINRKRLIKLTQSLIRISSENPGSNEYKIARFVNAYFKGIGLKSRIYEFKERRSNLVAVLPGRNRRKTLLLTPHLDTVPRGRNWHYDPFGAKIENGLIYGLGATDCKGNLACGIEAINSLVEDGAVLGYNLILAATADEECGSTWGLLPLLERKIIKPDAAVVLDSNEFDIIVTQKGLIHLKVKVRGKRAHGAYPWRGKNAIEIAIKIIDDLKKRKARAPANKYLRSPTMNIGTISGGDKVNVVADWCEFELDFRFLPGMAAEKILKDLKRVIRKHASSARIEIEAVQKPYAIKEGHSLVRYLVQAARTERLKASIKGSEGATTITFFQKNGIPAVATGFGSKGCAHISDEYVKINNLYRGARVTERFLKNYNFD